MKWLVYGILFSVIADERPRRLISGLEVRSLIQNASQKNLHFNRNSPKVSASSHSNIINQLKISTMASLSKPKLLMCANPVYGHVMSLRIIARLLIVRCYDVTFLTGSDFKQRIEDIGATFVSLEGLADVTEERLRQIIQEFINADPPRTQDDLIRQGFIDVIPSQVERMDSKVFEKYPEEKCGRQDYIVT
jgi:hypothetical protein